ncbi:pyridoxamine 5'-phosphate oxidase family protein [Metabacillus sp. GX 13764]|uniref:pyridoxamine 5'-phosphate oxidase family protein n=1 Tax=Metabacillus kandeliae TaxID=2900151 RepID=UPI001E41A44C|nr:pyridoxamine 5'-phosphate oxidase family protein [Metabacillus kandeliae]MCD7035161.1 pyridoxamine 5'-phosphate oxidase family protein [Metabacillus kandeliae]
MNQQELRDSILGIIEKNKIGTLATVKNNKPHSRYMTFFNESLTLYTPTNKETHKADEVESNPYVHILLGYDGEGYGDKYVEIEGKVSIRDDEELKHKLWNDHMKPWFEGPNDPEYIVLEIKPSKITYMNANGESPQTLEMAE